MTRIKRSDERGRTQMDWLEGYHSFSFGGYYHPENMQFGPLRVLNDDTVAGGGGFPMHPHDNMEIITYVTRGALEHRDSMGTNEVIHTNEVQRMTAGSGIMHSEFNHSDTDDVHLLQIWIIPDKRDYTPSYDQKKFSRDERKNKWLNVAGNNGSPIHINQDVDVHIASLEAGTDLTYTAQKDRGLYLHVISGEAEFNGETLTGGDAVELRNEDLTLKAAKETELILFDVTLIRK